jgi:hypothetical protein
MRDYASLLPVTLELDLYDNGWNGSLNPYPGITLKQLAMQSIRKSLVKKFLPDDTSEPDKQALDLFLKVNQACKEYSYGNRRCTEIEEIALGEAKAFLYAFCNPNVAEGEILLTARKITDNFSLGNGANIGSFGTDFLSKIGTSTMAATSSRLHALFKQAVSFNHIWSDVESIRSRSRGDEIVRGSRMSFAPKTAKISRTICTEPVCNMLFQKGIAYVLERRLREVCGIDLSLQPAKNRKLAQRGSYNGRFGTIDLSSASDSLSRNLVREFYPDHVVQWLDLVRTPETILPDGSSLELHMVSSMGNAFTFPLQTSFFTSLVYGAYRALDIPVHCPRGMSLGNFAVFGDDIIVVEQAYRLVCRLLCLCGFSVNVDKSFNEGPFRESCGQDFHLGHDVRGIYLSSLKTSSDAYSACNRLNVWSAKHGITLRRLVSTIMKGHRLMPVPFDEMDTAGVKVPSCILRVKKHDRNGALLYRALVARPISYSVSDAESQGVALRGWIDNHPAILLAALAGTLRNGKATIRASRLSYRVKQKRSPCWDYVPAGMGLYPSFGGAWKSFVMINLNFS